MMRSVCVYRAFRSRMFWTEVRPRSERCPIDVRRNLRKYAPSAATRTPPPARRGPAARAPHGLFPRQSELAKRAGNASGERGPVQRPTTNERMFPR